MVNEWDERTINDVIILQWERVRQLRDFEDQMAKQRKPFHIDELGKEMMRLSVMYEMQMKIQCQALMAKRFVEDDKAPLNTVDIGDLVLLFGGTPGSSGKVN
jgi:hypothetical protein